MPVRKVLGAIAVLVTLATSLVGLDVRVAAAAAAKVQSGPLVSSTTGNLVLTIPSATTAGTLLVATLSYTGTSSAASFAAPAGWSRGPNVFQTSRGAEIWYYAGNPGSISQVTFTFSTSVAPLAMGALSEWSGLAPASPLDASGTAAATTGSSVTVATSSAVAAPGELAITSISHSPSNSNQSFGTQPSGWTNLVKLTGSSAYASDYRLNPTSGAVASEVESSTKSGTWAAAVATFRLPCTAGSLSVGSPSSLSFPAVTLNGQDQQANGSLVVTPSDLTASGAGWNVEVTSTTFTNAGGKTLPASAATVTSASVAAATESCSLPTSSIAYPLAVPSAASAPAAVKLFNGAASTGSGAANVTFGVHLAMPGNTYSGSYTSTWTFTIASGP